MDNESCPLPSPAVGTASARPEIPGQAISRLFLLSSLVLVGFLGFGLHRIAESSCRTLFLQQIELQRAAVLEAKKTYLRDQVERTLAEIEHARSQCQASPERAECQPETLQDELLDGIRRIQLHDQGYLWVNHILDYEGGEDYAVRLAHPNPPESEGMLLSTSMEDIRGNTPYREELEGVKRDGEVFFRYFFRKPGSEKIAEKLSFAKLYRPYDWVIACGVYLEDVEESLALVQAQAAQSASKRQRRFQRLTGLALLLGLVITLYFRQRLVQLIDQAACRIDSLQEELELCNQGLREEVEERTEEIRASRRLYRDVYENSPDLFLSLDPETKRVLLCNDTFCELTGLAKSEVLGARLDELVLATPEQGGTPAEDLETRIGELEDRLSRKNTEVYLRTRSGPPLPVMGNARLAQKDSGEVSAIRYCFRDIRDLKRWQAERRELEQELRHTRKLESLGTLAGGVAHNFNNLLAAIQGYAELALEASPPGSQQEEDLNQILNAGNRAAAMVRQILTYTREKDQEACSVALAPLVREALQLVGSSLPGSIELTCSVDSEASVLGDPEDLQQAVVNLLTNSIQAIGEKPGKIAVEVDEIELPRGRPSATGHLCSGRFVRVRVWDDGAGIAPEHMESLFDPYFTTKPQGEGTGLGLSTVHGTVRRAGGAIEVESTPGEGTCFTLLLPVSEACPETGAPVLGSSPEGAGEHVLVVDDEATIRDVVRRTLVQVGYRVTTCRDGAEALEFLERGEDPCDLLLTDLSMPGMSGDQLIHQARRLLPELPILLCSGFDDSAGRLDRLQEAVHAILAKPISRGRLLEKVRDALDRTSGEDCGALDLTTGEDCGEE